MGIFIVFYLKASVKYCREKHRYEQGCLYLLMVVHNMSLRHRLRMRQEAHLSLGVRVYPRQSSEVLYQKHEEKKININKKIVAKGVSKSQGIYDEVQNCQQSGALIRCSVSEDVNSTGHLPNSRVAIYSQL